MHGHANFAEFWDRIDGFLGCYYLALAALNLMASVYAKRHRIASQDSRLGPRMLTNVWLWRVLSILFAVASAAAFFSDGHWIMLPDWFKISADRWLSPVTLSLGATIALGIAFIGRRFFVRPDVAWLILNAACLFLGLSLSDPDFAHVVSQADNVPIVGLLFLLGFFTWLGAYQAVHNDRRLANGDSPWESSDELREKVLVWPDLVYIELICMVAVTVVLILWAMAVKAPLEARGSFSETPNPAKAPWYFIGLQEMLLYFDPWMAGVVLPSLVIFGLMAIPYLDRNHEAQGYYTIEQRKFAYVTFQSGFLLLWIGLIVMGTFLRGPNWSFFGLYERWDPHKVETLAGRDLSYYVWVEWLDRARPVASPGDGILARGASILLRESLGLTILTMYFAGIPIWLARYHQFFRRLYQQMGVMRYGVMTSLLLLMGMLPIKMIARWTVNLSYFVSIQECRLNF